ncbi:MFS transporter [Sulfolobus sp. A20]|uniref:MFS transporter n=1 Tax=Sulfolobaceae TaxID=118883 RepID=UPI0008460977|nr:MULTISPECIES: MFS transporter [unclassified Sulfolobus]TRM75995.1 MFS transporter [Sulfolobus sp. E5]TRM78479.1 MFS transporter [Sulfolobus sp. B5]TRM81415.1 MFS transporter [Sulfolobus sp. D5]TRM85230.1 MFS transporter [Sulfolobus sp. F3]TRM99387.1 MFS transporter [Sulfolobus sp. F1]TRN04621.1 MFS transporter [Sulfolobus sp. E1]
MKKDDKLTSKHIKWILATMLAWTFDLYDLFSILFVTPFIAELFFPSKILLLSIAATYASFLTSFIMRPVGATYFGTKISDKSGRKRAIFYGILGLVITATLQGALPTYVIAGIIAPILLIILRLAEGFFVGGVTSGSHTIGPESVPERHRGWVGGLGFSAAGIAYLIAAGWFYLTAILYPGSEYLVWGWRVMFLGGLLPLIVLLFVNYLTPESEMWNKIKSKGELVKSPVRELFTKKYRRALGIALVITVGWALMYYIPQGLFPTFLAEVNKLPKTEAAITLIIASIGVIIGPTLGGEISQHIGRKLMSLIGGIIVIAVVSPLFLYLGSLHVLNSIILTAFLISLLSDFGGGIVMTYLNEIYPTSVRGTGVAFTWNTGFAIAGASPTIISLILASVGGFPKFPIVMFYSIIFAGLIILIGSVLTQETRGNIIKEVEKLG